jgi:hypothetical protein
MDADVTFLQNGARFDVLVNGTVVGQVFKEDFHTTVVVTRSGDARGHGVGRNVTRKNRWAWEADGMRNDDLPSRKAAVEDMLDFVEV